MTNPIPAARSGATLGYERVTYKAQSGRTRTIYLQGTREAGEFVVGVQVDLVGDEIPSRHADVRLHVIHEDAIAVRVPMEMDNLTGLLVPKLEGFEFLTCTSPMHPSGHSVC